MHIYSWHFYHTEDYGDERLMHRGIFDSVDVGCVIKCFFFNRWIPALQDAKITLEVW